MVATIDYGYLFFVGKIDVAIKWHVSNKTTTLGLAQASEKD